MLKKETSEMIVDSRPPRVELFAFYFLGFRPDGTYKFANAHHIARHYRVSSDAVLRWLEEHRLTPRDVLHRQYDLAGAQVELMIEAEFMQPEEIFARAAEILEELDASSGGRKPWEDKAFGKN